MKKIYKVYTKEGCNFCTKVLNLINLTELPFVQVKLVEDISLDDFKNNFPSVTTFPLVTMVENVDGNEHENIIGGSIEFVNFLKQNNFI